MPLTARKDAIIFPFCPASHLGARVSKALSPLASVGAAGTSPHQNLGPFDMTQLKYKISQEGKAELEDSCCSALVLILATHILVTLQMLFYRLQAETQTHLIFTVVQQAKGKAGSSCPPKEKVGFQMTQECPRDQLYLFMYLFRLASVNHR